MSWMQILIALFTLEQVVERAKQAGMTGKINVLIELKPEAAGVPPLEFPVGSIVV